MFFAALIIALGLAILLNTLGIMNGSFWGFFWAIFFIAAGIKMMMRKGKCPMCGWGHFMRKQECECEDCDCDHDSDGQDHH